MYGEELLAKQQSVYDTFSAEVAETVSAPSDNQKKRKKPPKSSQPTIKISQSSIYVKNVPKDVTIEELEQFFGKCGIILPDYESGKPRIKIYLDDDGKPKGDAMISYYRPESVQLAITILDETEIRPGFPVSVEMADFSSKESAPLGNATSVSEPKHAPKKLNKRKLEAQIKKLERHLDWEDTKTKASKGERSVVLKNLFAPQDLSRDPGLIMELKEELREECEKFGHITVVTLFDKHPDGVATIRFSEQASVAACIQVMNGRYFDGRKLEALVLDQMPKDYFGLSNRYETPEEEQARMKRYEQWIEKGGNVAEEDVAVAPGQDSSSDEGPEHAVAAEIPEELLYEAPGVVVEKRLIDDRERQVEEEEFYFEDDDDSDPKQQR